MEIPLDKLIPTVPLRLNYILWIEDLLSISKKEGEVRGIDIGCGASCVYPLIAAKKYCWKMIATEIDEASFEYARRNVLRNNLDALIDGLYIEILVNCHIQLINDNKASHWLATSEGDKILSILFVGYATY